MMRQMAAANGSIKMVNNEGESGHASLVPLCSVNSAVSSHFNALGEIPISTPPPPPPPIPIPIQLPHTNKIIKITYKMT